MITDTLFLFAWGLIVLSALVGWGGFVARFFVGDFNDLRTQRVDWGLKAGWGMAALLALGGLLSLFKLVSPVLLVGLVLIGALLWLSDAVQTVAVLSKPSRYQVILFLAVLIPLTVRYATAVHFRAFSCGDDDIAYFPFIVRLLDTGTLIDPFNLRRLAAYGGQTFLQAFIGIFGNEENAYLMDRGIGVLVSFGLTFGFFDDRAKRRVLPYALAILLIILLPFPLLNSASHFTGLVLFLTLFRTLERLPALATVNTRSIWLIALVLAGAASLRAHFLVAAALAVIFYGFIPAVQGREGWHGSIKWLFKVAGASLVCLSPWMLLLFRSSNTFLYPLFRGNHRSEFENYSAPLEFGNHFQAFADGLLSTWSLLYMLPIALFVFRRKYPAALALYVSALITSVIMAWIFTHSDAENIVRYVAPFLNAAFIATMISFTRDSFASSGGQVSRSIPLSDKILGGAMIVLLALMITKDVKWMAGSWDKIGLTATERQLYQNIQSSIPAGEKLMAIVNHPFALDYARNDISTIDVAGAVSPDPGVPYFKGAQAFKKYFLNRGISYLVVGNINKQGACLYNRQLWQHHQSENIAVWQMGAKYYLDLFDMLDELSATEEVVFRKNGFNLIKLKPL
jgi:hypothetical protein